MAKINIIHDKPLIEDIFQYDVIIVGTGIHNMMGNGFQHDIKINFPYVEKAVKKTPYADSRKLGTVTIIKEIDKPIFCVAFIHKGGFRKDINPDYLNYDALKQALKLVDEHFENKSIACPLLGTSNFDGNGDKLKIMEMFNNLSDKNDYYVYDYEQRDYREVDNEKWNEIISMIGKKSYDEIRQLKNEYIKRRKYGIFNGND